MKITRPYLILLLALLAALLLSVALGSVSIPIGELAGIFAGRVLHLPVQPTWLDAHAVIVLQLRLPRAMLLLLTGAALAGSGAAYQGLFRNPLADPYLIGVASGAGLGAVAAMALRFPSSLTGLAVIPAAAFVMALATVALVYSLARVGKTVPTTNLILAGVAVSAFASSVISFLMLRGEGELRRALNWLLGGAFMGGWQPVLVMLPYALAGLIALLLLGFPLNVLQFGEEQAQQMGLSVAKVRLLVVIFASLATASAVAFTGIIGFVGLVVPHVLRLLWGSDYRHLVPRSILGGAAFLLLADMLARLVMAPQELPVGVITALVGAPFFVWLLRRARQGSFW